MLETSIFFFVVLVFATGFMAGYYMKGQER